MSENQASPEEGAIESQKTANLQSIGLVLVSVVLAAVGQLTFKAALNTIGELELSVQMFVDLLTNPTMLLGLVIFGASMLLWLLALMKADLSFAYPFLSLAYILVPLGGAVLFNEQVTLMRIIGIVVIVGGLLVIARSETAA
ncbi:MAG: multidrug resistance protein [Anaerolineae bacterium]|nr:multidrug resistance protein [Anaerolineae bacterium]